MSSSPQGNYSELSAHNQSRMRSGGRIVNLEVIGRSRFSGASHEYEIASLRSASGGASGHAVMDARGAVAYDAKHRKPKWCKKSELDRFNRFEDAAFHDENTKNGRVRIEDPFARQPSNNKVFDHITDIEIAKYMAGLIYLDKQ